jgi:hypothetical protein
MDGETEVPAREVDDDGPSTGSVLLDAVRTGWTADSYLLRSYTLVAVLVAGLVTVLTVLAIPVWVAGTLGGGGTTGFSRAFLLLAGLLVVAPTLAPLVFAARHEGRRRRAAHALTGYLFLASLYVALVASAPPAARETPPAPLAPVVEALYALDAVYAVAFPVVGAAVVLLADRL